MAEGWFTALRDAVHEDHLSAQGTGDPQTMAMAQSRVEILGLHSPHQYGACPVCWLVTERSSRREDFPCRTLRALARGFGLGTDELEVA